MIDFPGDGNLTVRYELPASRDSAAMPGYYCVRASFHKSGDFCDEDVANSSSSLFCSVIATSRVYVNDQPYIASILPYCSR